MADFEIPDTPFFPGRPLPADEFSGRATQIEYLMTRGVGPVSRGQSFHVFLQGEYGIGKSSVAGFILKRAAEHDLHGIYANLGGARTLEDVSAYILQAAFESGAFNPTRTEVIRNLFSHLGKQELFGVTLDLGKLRAEAPLLAGPPQLLGFLRTTLDRLRKVAGVKGLCLVMDELNGIATHPPFAHLLKHLVDANARHPQPIPFLLILCGTEERRSQLVAGHEPVARIFDVVDVPLLADQDMMAYFRRAFEAVRMELQTEAAELMAHYSAGFPKVMQVVGDEVFYAARGDRAVTAAAATRGVEAAADEVGKKYVERQVVQSLRTPEYRSILKKIAHHADPVTTEFRRRDLHLSAQEEPRLDRFLQKMKRLNVLKAGLERGTYLFRVRMVHHYIRLHSLPVSSS